MKFRLFRNVVLCILFALSSGCLHQSSPTVWDRPGKRLYERAVRENCNAFFTAPFEGSVYPAHFPPPTFFWDAFAPPLVFGKISWEITVSDAEKVIYRENSAPPWTPSPELWNSWTGKTLTVQAAAKFKKKSFRTLPLKIEIDPHALPDDVLIRYFKPAAIDKEYYDTVEAFETNILWMDPLTNERQQLLSLSGNACVGCHNSQANSTNWTAVAVIGQQRRLMVLSSQPNSPKIEKQISPQLASVLYPRLSRSGEKILCTYPPDGRSLGIQTYELAPQEFVTPFEQHAFHMDVAVYDIATASLSFLPGASGPDYMEIEATWSPDEKQVAFTRNKPYFGPMDICVVPYNDGKGGEAKLLKGASRNGWDNYFPEYSPDGRWIAFTRGMDGPFARPSSDIYIVPASGGEARRLAFNTEGVMDSFHSWSSDGRWLLFASKRGGISTGAYIARIYEDGHSAQSAVVLPLHLGHVRVNMPSWIKKGRPPDTTFEEIVTLSSSTAETSAIANPN